MVFYHSFEFANAQNELIPGYQNDFEENLSEMKGFLRTHNLIDTN